MPQCLKCRKIKVFRERRVPQCVPQAASERGVLSGKKGSSHLFPVCFLTLFCQFLKSNSKYFTQLLQFYICYVSFLSLDSGDHIFVHITASDLQFPSQVTLR